MMTSILSFGLDIVILVALGVTIFYAVTLSRNLNKFRMHREEFNEYMAELSKHIETAENAVHNLKQAGLTTADQLRRRVRDGQHLSDELQIMIDSAENIATRLEGTVTSTPVSAKKTKTEKKRQKPETDKQKGKKVEADEIEDWFIEDVPEAPNNNEKPEQKKAVDESAIPSFFIQDREFNDEGGKASSEQKGELQTQAEKELYDALQKQKKSKVKVR